MNSIFDRKRRTVACIIPFGSQCLTIFFVLFTINVFGQSPFHGNDSIANNWQKQALVYLIEERDYYNAIEAYDSCLNYSNYSAKNIFSFTSIANRGKSYALYLLGNKEESEKFYKISQKDTSLLDFSMNCHLTGVYYMSQEQYSLAVQYLKAATWRNESVNTYKATIYSDLGKCLFALGDYRESISNCTQAINSQPGNADAFFYRGKALMILNNTSDGCKDLSKAGELGIQEAYSIMKEFCK